MDRRAFLSGLTLSAFHPPLAAQTPPISKTVRIGILGLRPPAANPLSDALMQGLRDRGYIEGRNLVIEWSDAQGREDRLPALAADLVHRRVDVIVIIGPAPLEAARKATNTIPLVMSASSIDPVAEGVAVSLARPGGNITGLTYGVSSERFGKQLELLKSAARGIARVAVLWEIDLEIFRRTWATPLAAAARILGLSIQEPVQVRTEQDLPAAFSLMKQRRADAVIVATGGSAIFPGRAQLGELALQHRLPAIAALKEFPQTGLLLSYGPDFSDINRRVAGYIDRILKGAKPGDLPIELPTRYELVINLKTANALGLTIPQSLLLRADEVIQ